VPLFGSKTQIGMELVRGEVVAGEPVQVSITIGEPDKKVRDARLELVYRNTYLEDDRDSDGDRRTVRRRTDVVAAQIPLFDTGAVTAGRIDTEIEVPLDAPGTAPDSVDWKVRAVVDRKMGNDAEAETPLTVLSPAEPLRSWAETPLPPSDKVRMALDASPRVVRPGDRITGTLRIAPHEAVSGRAIRVQLKRRRNDPDRNVDSDDHAVTQLEGEVELPAGDDRTYPFEVVVPPDAPPSFRARYNEQHWYLEGVIDVPRSRDPVVQLEVLVHTA
jgi:hypothetical protein